MAQQYQEAIAIVRDKGKPCLFVTFTCNPNWPEIKPHLHPNHTAGDRPNLVSRVFNLKLKTLLQQITKRDYFGKVDGQVYSVEFQKRGLPDAHILIIIKDAYKIRDGDDTDKIVSPELPNQAENPKLYDLVTSHMMHGPCGDSNPACPCMKDGVCSEKFPKDYNNTTIFETNGYPRYRRRNDVKSYIKKM